jgi:NNP family nitrate/nitrite transporter-like MFS transporter
MYSSSLSVSEIYFHSAGWFWWPLCLLSAAAAYVWMSNHPDHGNHPGRSDNFYNAFFYYWFEFVGLVVALVIVIILVVTRDTPAFVDTSGGKVLSDLVLVVVAMVLEHLALKYLSPPSTHESLREQSEIFNDKHTYIMTFLYTMCFGSFIGFSGAFPKLITDLFGYVTLGGCYYDDVEGQEDDGDQLFVPGGTEFDCVANGGEWGYETVTNPNAPDVFSYSWLGAFIGSVIRPVGGILADRHGTFCFDPGS